MGDVVVLGDAGPAVLLLPGGGEAVDGFFPGLAEGLVADGCRVVLWDRPSAGAAAGSVALADAPTAVHEMLDAAGLGPVVLVGQSLGGAVALMLVCAHPEDLAGLVLLDPTPVNDAAVARRTETVAGAVARVSRWPVLGRALGSLVRRTATRSMRGIDLQPAARKALLRTAATDLGRLGRAAEGLGEVAAAFDPSRLPRVPAAVVTADRRESVPVRAAHQRLATALGAPLVSWPRAQHAVHLTHPDEVLATVRGVVRQVRPGGTSGSPPAVSPG